MEALIFFDAGYCCIEAEEDGFNGGVVNQLVSFLAEGLCVFDGGPGFRRGIGQLEAQCYWR